MSSSAAETDHEAIRQLLKRIHNAWTQGRTDELNTIFHEDMVIAGPGFQALAKGREVCVRSYEDFIRQATIQECKETEPSIHVSGDTAVGSKHSGLSFGRGARPPILTSSR